MIRFKKVDVAFDYTCNLYCASCRNEIIADKAIEQNYRIAQNIENRLLPYIKELTVAGNGEVFIVKPYKHILLSGEYENIDLKLLTNGNLFSMSLFDEIRNKKYKSISVFVSVDAASPDIYKIVRRGGNWERLMDNLKIISKLRKCKEIEMFAIRFVVSAINYQDMVEFVRLGKSLGVDYVDFSKIENWGTYSDEEFEHISMILDGGRMKTELEGVIKEIDTIDGVNVKYNNFN